MRRTIILDFGLRILDCGPSHPFASSRDDAFDSVRTRPQSIQNPKSKIQNRFRRGFNLVELLIALAITAALLSAVMVALHASFRAYQSTTEVASTHTISRLIMTRMLTMIRTGTEFAPPQPDPATSVVYSDFIDFRTTDGRIITLEWKEVADAMNGFPEGEALYVTVSDGLVVNTNLLLEGVKAQYIPNTNPPERIPPFTLQYDRGKLYRATIDLVVVPDDNMSVELDGANAETIRLVASAIPRLEAY